MGLRRWQTYLENIYVRLVLEGRIAFDLRAAPGTQDYEAWAVTLLNKSKLIKHEEASQRFMTYAEHLQVLLAVAYSIFRRRTILQFLL